jgi:hypothetical protein
MPPYFLQRLADVGEGMLILRHAQDNLLMLLEQEAVDGKSPSSKVAEFEAANGYTDLAGGYGGLVPEYFNFGPLLVYFCGQAGQGGCDMDREIHVLACDCGEVGCRPLMTSVRRLGTSYRWSAFDQPHRPQRNYQAFGPFIFEQHQHENAVREAALQCETPRLR